MKCLLSDPHQVQINYIFEKPKLFIRERAIQEGLQTSDNNFSNEFVNQVAEGYGSKVNKGGGIRNLGYKSDESRV